MDTHLHQKMNFSVQDHVAEYKNPKEEAEKQKAESSLSSSSPLPPSSPSHEFSFTVSLQSLSSFSSSSSSSSKPNPNGIASKTQEPPSAIDLSPADDIFFHGHLLPLHLLSHVPVSPRASTNSLDQYTLPIKDLLQDQPTKPTSIVSDITNNSSSNGSDSNNKDQTGLNGGDRGKNRPKSFSFFGLSKWRKGSEPKGTDTEEKEKNKKKINLDLSHAVRKYMRMLFQKKENGTRFRRQAYSFSSASIMTSSRRNSNYNNDKRDLSGRRRREFSAPASMRTSPTNSGHLLVRTGVSSSSSCSASDSTMEELQAAIQAAIAHCKNSIAVEDNIKR